MSHPNAMGYLLMKCVSPLGGLNFIANGRHNPEPRPGLSCFALVGDRPPRKASRTAAERTRYTPIPGNETVGHSQTSAAVKDVGSGEEH